MNFFQHQDRARRQSRWLVFAFILAVLALVAVVDFALLVAFGFEEVDSSRGEVMPSLTIRDNAALLTGGAIATLVVIGLASLFKTISLRDGGGKIARDLGGTLITADTGDPRRRRLHNVVEEIAIASGVPVPEIYVLEEESAINAFAAGYTPADAAVAVTRGAIEKLSRDELQGVIAHEFSHILNGDMRINIRLMGVLFGILLLALIGRRVLIHSRFASTGRNKNGAPIILIAVALTVAGYVGLFFGRWIKAAVSRQREYLADASAVQFTRNPAGIGGALKKIAVYSDASYLRQDSEEVSHMLFGDGRKMMLFATHPPIIERIGRVDPSFQEEELDVLAARIAREQIRREKEVTEERATDPKGGAVLFDVQGILDGIGKPEWERLLTAAFIAASLPGNVRDAARSAEWAPEALLYALLDEDPQVREEQLLIIARDMGAESEAQVRALLSAGGPIKPEQRLPLMEIAFPAFKRRPADFLENALRTVEAVSRADERIDVFEYLLARLIGRTLWESANPHAVRAAGGKTLATAREAVVAVLSVLARHGHEKAGDALAAYRAGVARLSGEDLPRQPPETDDWIAVLDKAIPVLDKLKPREKERLVAAMAEVVLHDGQVASVELELLRAVCELIHVPLPLLSARG